MNTQIKFFAVALMMLVACGKDDPKPLATITVVDGQVEGVFQGVPGGPENGKVPMELAINSPEGFSALEITKLVNGETIEVETILAADLDLESDKQFSLPYIYHLSKTDVNNKSIVQAAVIDKKMRKGKPATLVQVEGLAPLVPGNFSFQINNPVDGDVNLNYYAMATGAFLYSMPKKDIIAQNLYSEVVLAMSINESLGVYLSSPKPNVLLENVLLETFTTYNATKIKKVAMTGAAFDQLGTYSSWKVKEFYDVNTFGPHEERASQVKIGDVYVFRTHLGATCIIRFSGYTYANGIGSYQVKGWMLSSGSLLN
jgi:hypothetical protein